MNGQALTKTDATGTSTDDKIVAWTPLGGSDAIKLSVVIIQRLLAVKTKSGATCSREDATKFLMMCQAKRLNPFEGDAYLVGYDSKDGPKFSLITAHQAFLKRAELYPAFKGMDSGIIVRELLPEGGPALEEIVDGNRMDPGLILRNATHQFRLQRGDFFVPGQDVVGGWATVRVENKDIPWHRRLRLERFNSGYAQWEKDPAGMICKCAEADALRSAFPTQFGGMYMTGEVGPTNGEAPDMTAAARSLVDVRPAPAALANPDEAAEAAAGLAPAKPAPATTGQAPSLQTTLSEMIAEAGFDFPTFVKWATMAGQIKDADSLPDWNAISAADCERILRSLRGAKTRPLILADLQKAKDQLV